MKKLRNHFIRNYPDDYVVGSIYNGDQTITYFPFTPESLKKQKLKIAIVFNQPEVRFEIWLAGQNKQIQKKYWEIFKDSDWNKYHIPSSINKGFSIVNSVLVKTPDFNDPEKLTDEIDYKTMEFINDILQVFE